MSVGTSFSRMQKAVINYVQRNLPKDKNNAVVGTIQGGKLVIANKTYSCNPLVDDFFINGDKVICLLPESGRAAAVVGKL